MKVLTNNKYYSEIANVIREQNGTNNTYKPSQMVGALKELFYEEVEGVPPISFNGNGEALLDYRIYGNAGGVGERTQNMFDKNNPEMLGKFYFFNPTKQVKRTASTSRSIIIPCLPSTTYSINLQYATYTLRFGSFKEYPSEDAIADDLYIISDDLPRKSTSYTTSPTANYLMIFCYNSSAQESKDHSIDEFFSKVMISQTPEPIDYEAYYKIPISCAGKTTNIYIDELLFENEIISFSDAKVSIPTQAGTNRLSIDTQVQPVKVYIKARKIIIT